MPCTIACYWTLVHPRRLALLSLEHWSNYATFSCSPLPTPLPAAEIIKRRIVGLHQNTAVSSNEITDVWEPIEEGLDRIETTRHVRWVLRECALLGWRGQGGQKTGGVPRVTQWLTHWPGLWWPSTWPWSPAGVPSYLCCLCACSHPPQRSVIQITLSKEPLDDTSPGYQPPLSESEVRPLLDESELTGEADAADGGEDGAPRRRPAGGRGRGSRGRGEWVPFVPVRCCGKSGSDKFAACVPPLPDTTLPAWAACAAHSTAVLFAGDAYAPSRAWLLLVSLPGCGVRCLFLQGVAAVRPPAPATQQQTSRRQKRQSRLKAAARAPATGAAAGEAGAGAVAGLIWGAGKEAADTGKCGWEGGAGGEGGE